MPKLDQPATMGTWRVKQGKEAEFIALWDSFAQWTSQNHPGAGAGYLIQDLTDPRRFVSFGFWESVEVIEKWREDPEFQGFVNRAQELIDDFQPSTLRLVATVSGA
jgi:heme-degrading monooxygenase HmoA